MDVFSEEKYPLVVPGFVGKPKGSRVHAWMRGHWTKGLTHKQCCFILSNAPDFKQEKSRLEKWWIHKGHGAVKTVTSTPESVEIEYDWGKGKYEFRNHINTKSTVLDVYRASVLRSLGRHKYVSRTGVIRPPPLPRRRHWRFVRRANDYLRSYSLFKTPRCLHKAANDSKCTLHSFIETSRRQVKSHRCVGAQQFQFTSVDDTNDQVSPEDDNLCHRYLIDDRQHVPIHRQVLLYLSTL